MWSSNNINRLISKIIGILSVLVAITIQIIIVVIVVQSYLPEDALHLPELGCTSFGNSGETHWVVHWQMNK